MFYCKDRSSGTLLVRWNDNSVVTIASTVAGVSPTGRARRWSAKEKKEIEIPIPEAIAQYNSYMGGVDRMDQNLGLYRISIRSKKWWWPLFSFGVESAVHNAWQLYRISPAHKAQKLDQLGFRRALVEEWLKKFRAPGIGHAGPSTTRRAPTSNVSDAVRLDGLHHYQAALPKPRRCRYCHKTATRKCSKCNVPLHNLCSVPFHTKQAWWLNRHELFLFLQLSYSCTNFIVLGLLYTLK